MAKAVTLAKQRGFTLIESAGKTDGFQCEILSGDDVETIDAFWRQIAETKKAGAANDYYLWGAMARQMADAPVKRAAAAA